MTRQHTALLTVVLVAALTLVVPLMAKDTAPNIAGTWRVATTGGQAVIQVNQTGQSISGVAHVYNSSGKEGSVHFYGTIYHNSINAMISGGHSFSGRVTSEGRVAGVVRTKGGSSIAIEGYR